MPYTINGTCPTCGVQPFALNGIQWYAERVYNAMVAKGLDGDFDWIHASDGRHGVAQCTCANCKSTLTSKDVGIPLSAITVSK